MEEIEPRILNYCLSLYTPDPAYTRRFSFKHLMPRIFPTVNNEPTMREVHTDLLGPDWKLTQSGMMLNFYGVTKEDYLY